MDFLQELGSHRDGLLLLKTELWWYGGRGWDGIRERVCLLMDARDAAELSLSLSDAHFARASAGSWSAASAGAEDGSTLLLVDGQPHWVRVTQTDVELL